MNSNQLRQAKGETNTFIRSNSIITKSRTKTCLPSNTDSATRVTQVESFPDEYDTYSITSFDNDTDIANLDSDIDEGHTEDFSIDSCSGFGLNVNTDHPPCTNKYAICHNVVHAA